MQDDYFPLKYVLQKVPIVKRRRRRKTLEEKLSLGLVPKEKKLKDANGPGFRDDDESHLNLVLSLSLAYIFSFLM